MLQSQAHCARGANTKFNVHRVQTFVHNFCAHYSHQGSKQRAQVMACLNMPHPGTAADLGARRANVASSGLPTSTSTLVTSSPPAKRARTASAPHPDPNAPCQALSQSLLGILSGASSPASPATLPSGSQVSQPLPNLTAGTAVQPILTNPLSTACPAKPPAASSPLLPHKPVVPQPTSTPDPNVATLATPTTNITQADARLVPPQQQQLKYFQVRVFFPSCLSVLVTMMPALSPAHHDLVYSCAQACSCTIQQRLKSLKLALLVSEEPQYHLLCVTCGCIPPVIISNINSSAGLASAARSRVCGAFM